MQPAAALDVRHARQLRRHEPAAEPELLAERDPFRFLNQQRVGTAVDGEAIDFFAEDHAAGPRRAVEHDERHASSRQLVRRGQPGNPRADDGDVDHRRARTRSSSMAMKVGEVFSDSVRRSVVASSRAVRAA